VRRSKGNTNPLVDEQFFHERPLKDLWELRGEPVRGRADEFVAAIRFL